MRDRFAFLRLPENILVLIGVIFGTIFLLITPPFQAEAEFQHFYRSFQISDGHLLAEKKITDCYGHQFNPYLPSTVCVGGMLPKSILTTAKKLSSIEIRYHPERKQKLEDIFDSLNLPLASNDRVFVRFSNSALYSPISYLPQALGIAFGRIFSFSPVVLIYLGRFFNLLVWALLVHLAIKIIPIYKWLLFLLALMPMSLFQAASLSADAITNGLSFLLIAICLRIALDEEYAITQKDILIISIVSVLICLSKLGYFPILGVFLIIPSKKIGNPKKYIITLCSVFLLSFTAILVWSLIIKGLHVPDRPQAPNRFLYILEEPQKFAVTLLNTLRFYGLQYIEFFIGRLGWIDTKLPTWHLVSYALVLVGVALVSSQKDMVVTARKKAISLMIFVANSILIFALIYITWSPLNSPVIEGFQGRYFIPLSPLFFLLLYNRKIQVNITKYRFLIVCYLLFSQTLTATVLLKRYYS